ncbi:nose resistant to fluoxetine protein 6-like [Plakobranchus ocellatus]|uniref:Nose resistant to fluoxetine protein 6-like n=1 Tax=Plakobranchus ocellatus TaxID=259542 RepID=A0AAV4CBW4_9GAST|nr:nose resistant to fluoxetine protein 6-like [Plakobranchus ocellatus]
MTRSISATCFLLVAALLVGNIAGSQGTNDTILIHSNTNVTSNVNGSQVTNSIGISNNNSNTVEITTSNTTNLTTALAGSTQTGNKSVPPATSDAGLDFARLFNLLRRAGGLVPELRDAITRRQPLSDAQRKELLDLARLFGNTLSSVPDIFQGNNTSADLMKLLTNSGLLESLANVSLPSWSLQGRGSGLTGDQPVPIVLDLCLPRSCETVDLNSALSENNASFIHMECTADLNIGDDPWAVVAVIVLSIFLALMVAGTLTEFCVGSKTRRRSEFINAFINSNSSADLHSGIINNGISNNGISNIGNISSITANGGVSKPSGFINGGFEMREVGYITGGSDARHRVSSGHVTGGRENMRPSSESGHQETSIEAKPENGDPLPPNGDYTDDLPSYYPFNKTGHSKGYLADPFLSVLPDTMPVPKLTSDMRESNRKTDDTAHLHKWQRLLLAFSLPRNTGKILGVKAGPAAIGCLHGIRVLSMGWVIWGHVLSFGGTTGYFKNRMDIYDLIKTFTFQVMVNATLSVDTFFFMSGLLTAYLFLKECGKKEKVTIKQGVMYYVHRYWRLTPPMLIWIMVVACIVQYVGEGKPGWTDLPTAQLCRDSWWVNLLYIQNLWDEKAGQVVTPVFDDITVVPFRFSSTRLEVWSDSANHLAPTGKCLGVTWYLANDMQFYVLAPLVMIPWVYKKEILGLAMALMLVVVHLVSNAWLVYEYNFDLLRPAGEYMQKLYIRPWTRCGPFAIGLIIGYILYKTKCKIHMNKYLVAIGWFFAMAIMLTLTLVTYDENKDIMTDPSGWPVGGKMVHETLSRPVWAMILGWIVVACATGHGGFINSILSWEGFLPLSRLTYCAYLIHLTLMSYEFFTADSTSLFTMTNLIYRFFGFYIMSYAVAFLLAVGVEAPMLGLEKVVLTH